MGRYRERALLLTLAATEGFDALVTVDRGIEHQQNVSQLPIPVIVMRASRSRLAELQPLVSKVTRLLSDPLENRIHHVSNQAVVTTSVLTAFHPPSERCSSRSHRRCTLPSTPVPADARLRYWRTTTSSSRPRLRPQAPARPGPEPPCTCSGQNVACSFRTRYRWNIQSTKNCHVSNSSSRRSVGRYRASPSTASSQGGFLGSGDRRAGYGRKGQRTRLSPPRGSRARQLALCRQQGSQLRALPHAVRDQEGASSALPAR